MKCKRISGTDSVTIQEKWRNRPLRGCWKIQRNFIYVSSSLKSHLSWHTFSLLPFDSIWNLSNLGFPGQSITSSLYLFYSFCFAPRNLQSHMNKIFALEHLPSLYWFLILCSQSGTVYSPLPGLTHRNGDRSYHIPTTSFSFANYCSAVSLKLLHESSCPPTKAWLYILIIIIYLPSSNACPILIWPYGTLFKLYSGS